MKIATIVAIFNKPLWWNWLDTLDLESSVERRVGSSPTSGTKYAPVAKLVETHET